MRDFTGCNLVLFPRRDCFAKILRVFPLYFVVFFQHCCGMKKISTIFALFVLSLSIASEARAAKALSAQDVQDIGRIEIYLNSIKSFSADFMQMDDMGGIARGVIAVSRPGKMRVNYAPPSKDFIIADGNSLHIWNDDLQEQTNIGQEDSLAQFILRDPVNLGEGVVVTKLERRPAKIEMTLEQLSDPGAGSLILVFEDNPLKLRQWRVVDAQRNTTSVSLENLSEGINFPESTFIFSPPNFGKRK